eukprot:CAMPEP_0114982138 /NCGR_PEP_ID=MMETSP0216-20121206/5931_1 /TAXON_ID=223996 /ORGANISM="Protocruzia adherens, Strain Boccale" /LENGTH=43 /DNA_ID= /DNA_START= /DNA_END= /DNA_ORIENTATION=
MREIFAEFLQQKSREEEIEIREIRAKEKTPSLFDFLWTFQVAL